MKRTGAESPARSREISVRSFTFRSRSQAGEDGGDLRLEAVRAVLAIGNRELALFLRHLEQPVGRRAREDVRIRQFFCRVDDRR